MHISDFKLQLTYRGTTVALNLLIILDTDNFLNMTKHVTCQIQSLISDKNIIKFLPQTVQIISICPRAILRLSVHFAGPLHARKMNRQKSSKL